MQLRRFTGDSMPTALGAVRQALGDEAIILSNRQVDGRIEIVATAMLDERAMAAAEVFETAPLAPVATATAPSNLGIELHTPAVSPSLAPDVPPSASTVTAWAPLSVPPPSAPASEPARGEARDRVHESVPGFTNGSTNGSTPGPDPSVDALARTDVTAFPAESTAAAGDGMPFRLEDDVPPAAPRDGGPTSSPTIDASAVTASVTDAVEAVFLGAERRHEERAGQIEARFRRLEVNLWGDLEPLKATHLRQLLRLGIGAELGVRLTESVVPGSTGEAAMRRSLALLKASLPVVGDSTGLEPGVTVLSGPAGGGKTTALVKLATRQVQREGNQSVVMIAADNRRIGAFESLQVYGRLLGVPVVQAHDGAELASLIEAFSHKSLVLVDHVPPERRETMPLPAAATLGTRDGVARRLRHLMVLPATLESRTFEALVERHRELGVTAAVLTQLDVSARLGVCLAPLVRHQLGIAYWSDNARVQTPLEKANASVLVAAVMATGGQLASSVDEELLLDLVQPTRRDIGETLAPGAAGVTVSATATFPADARPMAMTDESTR